MADTDSSPSYREMLESIKELGEAVELFKNHNDELMSKKANGESVADLQEKVDRINRAVGAAEEKKTSQDRELEAYRLRIEELEALYSAGGNFDQTKALHDEHREAFYKMLMNHGRQGPTEALRSIEEKVVKSYPDQKRVDITTGAAGEFLLPEVIRAQIEMMEQKDSPVRNLIPAVPVTTNDFKQVVDQRGTASGWVGEADTRSLTATPALRQRAPTMGELYARPEATMWSAMDLQNVDGWLARSVSDEFIKAEGQAVISGDGSNKPTGFLNTTPLVTADEASPLRSAEAVQFVAAPSPDDITEHVLNLIYTLQSGYRAGSAFAMNSNTLREIRVAKDSNGQYLWQPSLIAGQPPEIAGFPFTVWEDMPDAASPDDYPIAFGNWARAYLLVERSSVRVIRDEITNPGFIRWFFFRREGGILLNNDALKVAKR